MLGALARRTQSELGLPWRQRRAAQKKKDRFFSGVSRHKQGNKQPHALSPPPPPPASPSREGGEDDEGGSPLSEGLHRRHPS